MYHRQNKLDQAAACYRHAVALAPNLAETHSNLAAVLAKQGDLPAAATCCQRALTLNPGLYQAYINSADSRRKQGQLDQAKTLYQQAIALKPDYAEAFHNLGGVLERQDLLELARAAIPAGSHPQADLVQACNSLGKVLRKQGKLDKAVATLEQYIAVEPHAAQTHKSLSKALKSKATTNRALASVQQALALRPDSAEALYDPRDLKTFQPDDPDLSPRLEALARAARRLPPSEMLFVHFALGKALEDIGEYRRAFEHFQQANALKRREVEYDEAASLRHIRRLIHDLFDRRLLHRLAGSGDPSPAPIFIVGMPRSGSTLVEQILASHPQVHAAGELTNLDRMSVEASSDPERPADSVSAVCVRRSTPTACGDWAQAYLASLPPLPEGKTRITDKMPGNFLHVGLIRLISAQCPDHPHHARSGRYLRFVLLAAVHRLARRSATTWPNWAAITAGITS